MVKCLHQDYMKEGVQVTDSYMGFQQTKLEVGLAFSGSQSCLPNYSYGPAVRDHYILHYIIEGKGTLKINEETYSLEAGDLFIIPKNKSTFYQADEHEPWHYCWLGIDGYQANTYLSQSDLMTHYHLKNITHSDFYRQFCSLYDLAQSGQDTPPYFNLTGQLYLMLHHLTQDFPKKKSDSIPHSQVYCQQAITYMSHYYGQPITITEVCHSLNLSRGYLHKIFIKEIGQSPKQFLSALRLNKACQLLAETSYSITIIAHSVGYEDVLTFSKAFKKSFNLSPSRYRNKKSIYPIG